MPKVWPSAQPSFFLAGSINPKGTSSPPPRSWWSVGRGSLRLVRQPKGPKLASCTVTNGGKYSLLVKARVRIRHSRMDTPTFRSMLHMERSPYIFLSLSFACCICIKRDHHAVSGTLKRLEASLSWGSCPQCVPLALSFWVVLQWWRWWWRWRWRWCRVVVYSKRGRGGERRWWCLVWYIVLVLLKNPVYYYNVFTSWMETLSLWIAEMKSQEWWELLSYWKAP